MSDEVMSPFEHGAVDVFCGILSEFIKPGIPPEAREILAEMVRVLADDLFAGRVPDKGMALSEATTRCIIRGGPYISPAPTPAFTPEEVALISTIARSHEEHGSMYFQPFESKLAESIVEKMALR